MKYGQRLTMLVERMDDRGRGLGPVRDPEKPAAPPKTGAALFTLPGETLEGAFVGRDKGLIRFGDPRPTEPSPDRALPECPHAGICGGCAWQHIHSERQLELKREAVDRAFAEAGLELRVGEIAPAEERFYYRNRMDYVFGAGGELGLKQAGRWDKPVDLSTCLLLSQDGFEVLNRVRAWAKTTSHAPWDNRRHEGYLRYLVIREGKNTGERMALLVTSEGALDREKELVEALSPLCTSILHGVNPLLTDLSTAQTIRALHGEPLLREKVGGVTYRIRPNSFFQTNSRMAGRLAERVRAAVLSEPCERLLDLYCGSGFFALALAGSVPSALGIELDPEAIAAARESAAASGIANAEFRAEPAESLGWEAERPDVVIVDPPRAGLHPKVRALLLEKRPRRIVYVSCNYRALATDLKAFLAAYDAAPPACLDLFPHTPHVETVTQLTLRPEA